MVKQLLALRYPDRAESLPDFERYRVFLDHWQPLIDELSKMRRALFARKESRTLGIYAPQGSGKTLFARRVAGDIEKSRSLDKYDPENLWHRVAVDDFSNGQRIVAPVGNLKVLLRDAGHDDPWIDEIKSFVDMSNNRAIVLLDEADQAYLQLRLLGMDMDVFLSSSDQGRLLKASAEKFVKQCRTNLRGTLFVMLSNRRDFLETFADAVNGQHQGMMTIIDLPAADGPTKEKVVRTNTNRLNPFSYWYCINNATPARKSAIYDSLVGAGTFPAAFEAVDAAVGGADRTRMGRPAIKNHLTLTVLHETNDESVLTAAFGRGVTEFRHSDATVLTWTEGWTANIAQRISPQSAAMLESEWNLRVVLLGPKLVGPLLALQPSIDALRDAIDVLFNVPSPYAQPKTIEAIMKARSQAIDLLTATKHVPTQSFWAAGQVRSTQYEDALRSIYPTYNLGTTQLKGFRPDLVHSAYDECSVLKTGKSNSEAIASAIRRNANYVEFTAVTAVTKSSVVDYLAMKIQNYVRLMESA